jgi:hypothetical protein
MLIERGSEAEERKEQQFVDLAGRLRAASDRVEVQRLGDELGRMVFGGSDARPSDQPGGPERAAPLG